MVWKIALQSSVLAVYVSQTLTEINENMFIRARYSENL